MENNFVMYTPSMNDSMYADYSAIGFILAFICFSLSVV